MRWKGLPPVCAPHSLAYIHHDTAASSTGSALKFPQGKVWRNMLGICCTTENMVDGKTARGATGHLHILQYLVQLLTSAKTLSQADIAWRGHLSGPAKCLKGNTAF